MITLYTYNKYFLVIKLYKVIVYLCYTYTPSHTSQFTQITLYQKINKKIMHKISITHAHTHTLTYI